MQEILRYVLTTLGVHFGYMLLKLPQISFVLILPVLLPLETLDNFWFTLCHELAHLALHLGKDDWELFFDDLECSDQNDIEDESDIWASDVLIPAAKWSGMRSVSRYTASHVRAFAEDLRIHPAIPAGRIRREQQNHRLFTKLTGNGTVRRAFSMAP